jgi:hypothetical protein
MFEELYNEIHKADLIIADLSGLSPNVLFEAGYAYGLNKQLFLLTNNAEKLPSNLSPLRKIVFDKDGLLGLKEKLISALGEFFEKKIMPGQDENGQKPGDDENDEKPFLFTGWNKWGDDVLSVYADANTIIVQGKVVTAGYVNDKLSRKLAGKTLVLYIANTEASSFSLNRLLKMTVTSGDRLLKPKNNIPLVSNEYIIAMDGKVEYEIPENFDGKLGFVFYEADLKFLKISAFVK